MAQVYNLNRYYELYNQINDLDIGIVKGLYRRLCEEYYINKSAVYKMSLIKLHYFDYVDSTYLPNIQYLRNILLSNNIDISDISNRYIDNINW